MKKTFLKQIDDVLIAHSYGLIIYRLCHNYAISNLKVDDLDYSLYLLIYDGAIAIEFIGEPNLLKIFKTIMEKTNFTENEFSSGICEAECVLGGKLDISKDKAQNTIKKVAQKPWIEYEEVDMIKLGGKIPPIHQPESMTETEIILKVSELNDSECALAILVLGYYVRFFNQSLLSQISGFAFNYQWLCEQNTVQLHYRVRSFTANAKKIATFRPKNSKIITHKVYNELLNKNQRFAIIDEQDIAHLAHVLLGEKGWDKIIQTNNIQKIIKSITNQQGQFLNK
jgi:hypothetical protein